MKTSHEYHYTDASNKNYAVPDKSEYFLFPAQEFLIFITTAEITLYFGLKPILKQQQGLKQFLTAAMEVRHTNYASTIT